MRILLIFSFALLIGPFSYAGSQQSNAALYSHYLKGLFSLKRGDYETGLKELQKTKEEDSQSVHARLKVAMVLIRLGRTDEAEKVLLEAKSLDPDNLEISLALIFIYSYAKKDKELEGEYEKLLLKAHELKPQDLNIAEYLGQFYFYKKNIKSAIKVYESILEQDTDYVEAYFWLGYLYSEESDLDKAADLWQKGLAIDPDHAQILNSLGYIYAQQGVKLKKAEEMIKKALEQDPDNGAYLDSLGWIYYKKGDFKKALGFLEKAIERAKDPEIYLHLGDVSIALNDIEKGLTYYKQGLEHFPDDKDLKVQLEKYERKSKKNKR
jgi:tetratricopeptide (TPR) repeat protein